MDLSAWLRAAAFTRPHLLLVTAPTAVRTRLAVERYARLHGWPLAESPADADVLVVAGSLGADLADVVGVLETQMPAPWTRVDLADPDSVPAELDSVPAQLADWSLHRGAVPSRSGPAPGQARDREQVGHGQQQNDGGQERRQSDRQGFLSSTGHGSADGGRAGHEADGPGRAAGHGQHMGGGHDMGAGHASGAGHDMGGHDMGGHDMGGHDMGGHDMGGHDMGGHDMGGHDMGGHGHGHDMGPVAGLPLAGRAPDRDGLKLDVLHVPLGPVLPFWPAGLRVVLSVQGDVVQEATVATVGLADAAGVPFWDEPVLRALAGQRAQAGEVARRRAASQLDSLVRLLGVAGWDVPAMRCAVLRDRVLDGERADSLVKAFGPLARRLTRSRVLRRMTVGLGELDERVRDRVGLSSPAAIAAGDVWARFQRWVRLTGDDLARVDDRSWVTDAEGPRGPLDRAEPPSVALLGVLPGLLVGAELAGVRLIVASLDPDVAEISLRSGVTAHG